MMQFQKELSLPSLIAALRRHNFLLMFLVERPQNRRQDQLKQSIISQQDLEIEIDYISRGIIPI